jgi:hypothetical protein
MRPPCLPDRPGRFSGRRKLEPIYVGLHNCVGFLLVLLQLDALGGGVVCGVDSDDQFPGLRPGELSKKSASTQRRHSTIFFSTAFLS